MKKLFYYLSAIVALMLVSCSDDNPTIDNGTTSGSNYLIILSEGSFNEKNTSTLAQYDISSGLITKDFFKTEPKREQRELGDVGNDMILYGSKLYIVMNGSGTIEVVDPTTGISIKQINMKQEDNSSKEPRQITSYDGKVYVTSYDDTVTRIDTASLTIDGNIQVGMDPDGIVASNGKLYVANSGGLNYMNGYNNTMSIIDIATFKETDEIEVSVNPTNLDVDKNGNIYISAHGNHNDISAIFQKYNPTTGVIKQIEDISSPGKFLIHDNKAYIVQGSYGNPNNVLVYDLVTEKVLTNNFITDGTKIEIIHSISVDEKTGDLFIMESDYTIPGSVYCFDKDGKLKYKIDAIGLNPTSVIAI